MSTNVLNRGTEYLYTDKSKHNAIAVTFNNVAIMQHSRQDAAPAKIITYAVIQYLVSP